MYFYERPDCITLSSNVDPYGTPSGIFLFKNFIPEELMLDMEKEIESQEYRDNLIYKTTLINGMKHIIKKMKFQCLSYLMKSLE